MRAKDWLIILLCTAIGLSLLTAASTRLPSIHKARTEMGLTANESLENAPPSLAFATVAMGAFRGLIVDILWMRADSLKQEGKFFDAKQLADWITTLQPRFTQVWDFHAWNMAYNISVAIPNTQPEERWRWVKNGCELLRDRAIPLNPNSISLYRSLAWIYQHKIGDISDDCHRFYKREIALSMRALLGEKPDNALFEALWQSPQTLEEIMADPEIAAFVDQLQRSDPALGDLKKLVNNYAALRQTPGRFSKDASDLIEQYRGTEAFGKFDLFARAWQLRNTWKFDIKKMIELNQKYGPMDLETNQRLPLNWEHPAVHAMYWAQLGLDTAGRIGQYRVEEKNTDRIIFHSLQMLYRTGTVVLYDVPNEPPSLYTLPDLRMFQSCDESWKNIIVKYESLEKGNPKAVRGGHKNFLENALLMFYQAGYQRVAQQLYQRLRTEHLVDEMGMERPEYKLPFMTFVRSRLREELQDITIDDATEFIITVLREGYFLYALHNDNEAAGRENMAQEVWDIYQNDMGKGEPGRMGMPPMDWFRYQAFLAFINDPGYPEYMRMSLIGRIQIERPDLFEKLKKMEIEIFKKPAQQQSAQPAQ
ncbi:MAG: hypothetical protein LLF76_08630 [Planctomycetaceae bacterium]|nr:hypothetical protein [Planctomycetaceae bacterium]